MKLKFHIHYHTDWGQKLQICGSLPQLGDWQEEQAANLFYYPQGNWELEIEIPDDTTYFEYKYLIRHEPFGGTEWEFGVNRKIYLNANRKEWVFLDSWRSNQDHYNNLYTSPFKKGFSFFPEPVPYHEGRLEKGKKTVQRFMVQAPRIGSGYEVCISGNGKALGNWEDEKAIPMQYRGDALWEAEVHADPKALPMTYKYAIRHVGHRRIVEWEAGENRYFYADPSKSNVKADEPFRYAGAWKGAGVAIPVFSLRSEKSFGVGEFTDLKLMVDWAKKTGMKVLQILPVNDTVATHTWTDSYPYAAISVFALHPIYLNIEKIGALSAKVTNDILAEQQRILNAKEKVDYELVMRAKSRFYKLAYDEQGAALFQTPDFKAFFEQNKSWLVPYGVFSYLRDLYGTPDFTKWDKYQSLSLEQVEEIANPEAGQYHDIAVHYFIQYHLHRQLLEASEYARQNGVVLKGDIPIGIYRNSVDAWLYPHLFNMDAQAGAPPDAFSVTGQNWGFPTYNWEEMAKDGYAWWVKRLQHMSHYFDVFRIDHILGFFRIWEIPWHSIEGLSGVFNPALPLHIDELRGRGLGFEYDRYCKPYIREHILEERFAGELAYVKETFLDEYAPGQFQMKPEFDTQRKIDAYLSWEEDTPPAEKTRRQSLKASLFSLLGEVIFFEEPLSGGTAFHPRNSMHYTKSYLELDDNSKGILNELYTDYFYHRHDDFWREKAMVKLPALKNATDMLICGEDLGMVPDCVPGVMDELAILSLAIQRMPNNPKVKFGHPSDAPYLSVNSTSTHDMPPLRSWWEEDQSVSQRFFNEMLGHEGEAPYFCEPWLAKEVINQHLWGNSMLSILPLQDWLAIDGSLRKENPHEEQINVPANPKHYWRYRMHLTLEQLMNAHGFNTEIKEMIERTGRNPMY